MINDKIGRQVCQTEKIFMVETKFWRENTPQYDVFSISDLH
jgi:hypothetical protein